MEACGEGLAVSVAHVTYCYSAGEVTGKSYEGRVPPVLGSTGLSGNDLVCKSCSGTCTVFNNVFQHTVHYPCSLIGNCLSWVAVVLVDDVVVAVFDLCDDVSLVVDSLISVGDICIYEVFKGKTLSK